MSVDDESPGRRIERPAIQIDDPNDWQKLQGLREIAGSKERYKESLAEALDAQTFGHPMQSQLAQRAHNTLIGYIHELLPSIEKAMGNESVKLSYDYWGGVHLGSLDVPEPPFEYDLNPTKTSGTREVVDVSAAEGSTEFIGLRSIVDSPPVIPVVYTYKTHLMNNDPTDTIVVQYPVPLSVIQRAGGFIELFRDEIGLDLSFTPGEYRSEEPGL